MRRDCAIVLAWAAVQECSRLFVWRVPWHESAALIWLTLSAVLFGASLLLAYHLRHVRPIIPISVYTVYYVVAGQWFCRMRLGYSISETILFLVVTLAAMFLGMIAGRATKRAGVDMEFLLHSLIAALVFLFAEASAVGWLVRGSKFHVLLVFGLAALALHTVAVLFALRTCTLALAAVLGVLRPTRKVPGTTTALSLAVILLYLAAFAPLVF